MKKWIVFITATVAAATVLAMSKAPSDATACGSDKACAIREASGCKTDESCASKKSCDMKKAAEEKADCSGGTCPLKK